MLSAWALALKLCGNVSDIRISYEKLHDYHKRATPMKMMGYRLAVQLYKIYNCETQSDDWVDLNHQQNFNDRNNHVQLTNKSLLKIGKNILINRMTCINEKIEYGWLNQSFESFKIKCIMTFLGWEITFKSCWYIS